SDDGDTDAGGDKRCHGLGLGGLGGDLWIEYSAPAAVEHVIETRWRVGARPEHEFFIRELLIGQLGFRGQLVVAREGNAELRCDEMLEDEPLVVSLESDDADVGPAGGEFSELLLLERLVERELDRREPL